MKMGITPLIVGAMILGVGAGLIIVTEPPEFFTNLIKSDYAKYGKLIRDAKIPLVD